MHISSLSPQPVIDFCSKPVPRMYSRVTEEVKRLVGGISLQLQEDTWITDYITVTDLCIGQKDTDNSMYDSDASLPFMNNGLLVWLC